MILFLPEAAFRHQAYLEQLGKILARYREPALLFPFIVPPVLFNNEPVRTDYDTVINYHSIYNKPLVDLLGAGMLPAISIFASDRKMIQWSGNSLLFNEAGFNNLTGKYSSLICSPFIKNDQEFLSVSPLLMAELMNQIRKVPVVFLTEALPPDGISTDRELFAWLDGTPRESEFKWVPSLSGSYRVFLASINQIHSIHENPDSVLQLRKIN